MKESRLWGSESIEVEGILGRVSNFESLAGFIDVFVLGL